MGKELKLADLVEMRHARKQEIEALKNKIKKTKLAARQSLAEQLKLFKKTIQKNLKEQMKQDVQQIREQIKLKECDIRRMNSQIDLNLEGMVMLGTTEPISEDSYGWEVKNEHPTGT